MLSGIAVTVAMGCVVAAPSLYLKDNVRVNGFHFTSKIVRILDVARRTAPKMERGAVWVTSANDSRHSDNSLHYKNRAFDIRVLNIVGDVHREAKLWAERMQVELGPDYDIIYEKTHIHIEYDPDVTEEEAEENYDGFNYCTS